MRVTGIDGKEHVLKLGIYGRNKDKECSSLHDKARDIIKNYYPLDRLHEEVPIPGGDSTMYLDFFLPLRKIAVEVQGEQHYKFNPHFHKNELAFFAGQKRDRIKKEWCQQNLIILLEFPFNESDEQWSKRISEAAN